jgi:3-mercaptopyruvate sulfurtransferase SseA
LEAAIVRGIFAGLLVLAAAAVTGAQEPDLSTAPRIQMAEFKSLYTANQVLVVDVRDEASFATGHMPGARSTPLGRLLDPRSVAELKATKKEIVLYCA